MSSKHPNRIAGTGHPPTNPRTVAELRRRLVNRFSNELLVTGHHLALMGYGQMDLFGVHRDFMTARSDIDHGRIPGTQTLGATSMQIDERLAGWPPEARRMMSLQMGVAFPDEEAAYATMDYQEMMRLPPPSPMTLDDLDPNHRIITADEKNEAIRRGRESLAQLQSAELFIADPEMCALLQTAQQTLPPQPLLATDPLTESGFVHFPEPVTDPDNTEMQVGVHALSWHVSEWDGGRTADRDGKPLTKVTLCTWVSPEDVNGKPGIHPLDPLTSVTHEAPFPLLIAWRYEWLVGEPHSPRSASPTTRDLHRSRHVAKGFKQAEWFTPGFHQRLAVAFWTIARQPLAAMDEAPLPATLRRKYTRTGIRTASTPIKVLKFRKREDAQASALGDRPLTAADPGTPDTLTQDSDHGRVYRHRWVVRGFWRNQWYSTLGTHRAVWIAAHIRGPANAPLLGAERVFLVEGR